MRKFVFLFAGSLLLAGCGDPKLDGSSEEAMKKSVQKISESLSSEKKARKKSDRSAVVFFS